MAVAMAYCESALRLPVVVLVVVFSMVIVVVVVLGW